MFYHQVTFFTTKGNYLIKNLELRNEKNIINVITDIIIIIS